ncbi:MAG TPA: glycosyltransferase family 2 protein [Rhodanobacteraceae bacterium]|nr:glycosyltransferase family 2 protein [Rhodanobacteraceae bacterium]
MPPPLLSVLIVAADSGPSLADCVHRALACAAVGEVLVLDNASTDGMPEAVEREHAGDPRVRVVRNGANLGFGAAMNRGAALVRSELLLLLNPDCLLVAGDVETLLETLSNEPRAGLVGAVVCDADGIPDPASRRRDPLLRRSLSTLTGRASRESDDPRCEGIPVSGPMPDDVEEEEAVSGALMLTPREVFDQLGGFDEGYFLHCEDLDLCRRVRDAGYRVLLDGRVRVHHAKGGSSRHRPIFVSRHKHRGMWRWFRKFDPAARNPLVAGVVWCGIWVHFLADIPRTMLKPRV